MSVKLPGFGLPLNYTPKDDANKDKPYIFWSKTGLFPSALDSKDLEDGYTSLRLTPLREFKMLQIMNQLSDKAEWNKKVFDKNILKKWKQELLSDPGQDVTEKMVDYCFAELQYKASIFESTGLISVYDADVVKSDRAIPESLRSSLLSAVKVLENVPDIQKDWHPGSDEKVLDLVHPSLFPLVYGKSRIIEEGKVTLENCIDNCGEGKILPIPPEGETDSSGPDSRRHYMPYNTLSYSRKFQWLPCNVAITGGGARITSYINNLHPTKHKELYTIIEQLISYCIPLWNTTLQPLKSNLPAPERIPYFECKYDPDPENGAEEDHPPQQPDEDDNAYQERLWHWFEATRQVVLPEPEDFQPPGSLERTAYAFEDGKLKDEYRLDLQKDFDGLQVIVKLANIHLTPEKPEYEGGTWHVEGQLNEHICATALYYYDNENITTSRLAFRQQSTWDILMDISYEQDHHDWLSAVFGCEQDETTVQYVGTVDTKQGRLITFPNILQHQVQPFKLLDPTKPGHRKVVALFLVDPHMKIISTANIPCQQREWWAERLAKVGNEGLAKFPGELQDMVIEKVEDFPISLEEAKKLRLELMEERRNFIVNSTSAFEQHTFSLCEH